MDSPNFVFIITDQHRADYLGCYGHPVLKTPHIDAMAAAGTRFDRCYVNTPICMPNRAALMTGRIPSVNGVRHNGIPLDPTANTFVHQLRAHGYRTALVGKSHLQTMTGNPPMLKREVKRPDYRQPPAGMDDASLRDYYDERVGQERPQHWASPDARVDTPFYGFEHVDLVTDHGDQAGGDYLHWLRDQGVDPDALRGPDKALPHDYVCPQAWRTAVPEELYPTRYVLEKSRNYLRRHARWNTGQPFFLKVSFPDPHHPFTPPGKYWDMYRPEDMTLPASFHPQGAYNPPPTVRHCHEEEPGKRAQGMMAFAVNEREAREAMALSCGMIAMIDDAVGELVAELEALGLAENTVLVFTADHGDFLGDHRLLLKGPIHYQSVLRVPFIWKDTADRAHGAAASGALTETIDLPASILDRAGIEPYHGMQGRSILPLLQGEARGGDEESVLVEEDGQRILYGLDTPPRVRSLVTARHRLTVYHGETWGELYDLHQDPHEMNNLWNDPAAGAVKMDMLERLARKQMALTDRSPLPFEQA
ncbi:sulfatase [Alkalilimnicola sp. S0819]|uniref:sulfatase family protein n=1 Tax=Alkalilimnicola sp. S0819 TaxID=2613922 RepID=UPI001261FEE7|nr:sulfatase-like hydrolase/transferase [Alkalilimnicola sp. S0819]KAB7619515.1 sulfatase-like hydrolase/transferase [Alkalilimnicola sp. S0819]MPQ17663.1 sulfatase-like hydrolase/transferase [Alkalilimnicola sp. S0819]